MEKKEQHKGRKIVIIICIILVNILLMTLICLYCYQTISKKNVAMEQQKREMEQLQENSRKEETTEKEETNKSTRMVYSKIQERKAIGKDTHKQNIELYVDVDIPCINRTNETAKKLNNQIISDYKKEIEFVQGKNTDVTDFTNSIVKVSYTYEEKNGVLYILVQKDVTRVLSEAKTTYQLYVYDQANGTILTPNDIAKRNGLDQTKLVKALQEQNANLNTIGEVSETDLIKALSNEDTYFITIDNMGNFMAYVKVGGMVNGYIHAVIS